MKNRSMKWKLVILCAMCILTLLIFLTGIPVSEFASQAAGTMPNGDTMQLRIYCTESYNNNGTYININFKNQVTGVDSGYWDLWTDSGTGGFDAGDDDYFDLTTHMNVNTDIPCEIHVYKDGGVGSFGVNLTLLVNGSSVWSASYSKVSSGTTTYYLAGTDYFMKGFTIASYELSDASIQNITTVNGINAFTIPKASQGTVKLELGFKSITLKDQFNRLFFINYGTDTKYPLIRNIAGYDTFINSSYSEYYLGAQLDDGLDLANGASEIHITHALNYTATGNLIGTPINIKISIYGLGFSYELTSGNTVCLVTEFNLQFLILPSSYTFTLNANGGTVGGLSSTTIVRTHDDTSSLSLPTRAGYTFNGWKNGTTFYTNTSGALIHAVDDDITLTADYTANNYTITYDYQGADGNNTTTSKSVTYDATYSTLPSPTRTGYTFNGWYTASLGGNQITAATVVATASNHTLYAQWTANTYTVNFTYQGADGNNTTVSKTVTYDATYGTLPAPTKTGYTFNGWFTAASQGTQVTSSTTVLIVAAQTLYAQYTANTYTVNFSYQGADGNNTTVSKTVTYDATYGTLPSPTKTGYTFNGWFTATSQGTQVLATTIVNITAAQTLYAQYTANTYTVNFSYQGADGNNTTASKTVTYDATYSTLPAPTRTGYTFNGWFTLSTGGTAVTSETTVKIVTVQTIFAQWTANQYVVTYAYQNATGDNTDISKTVTYDSTYGTLPIPTLTGYTFNGWFTLTSGGNEIVSTTAVSITAAQTIFAQWTANQYAVTFDYQNATGDNSTVSKTVIYDAAYGELPIPTRDGYTLTGWFTLSVGGEQISTTTAVSVANAHTLYAQWTINTNTLILDGNGADNGLMGNIESDSFDTTGLPLNLYSRTGYTFEGWAETPTGEIAYEDEADYTMGTDSEYTLYAVWKGISYQIYFQRQGGVDGTSAIIAVFGSDMPTAVAPDKAGYTFNGYFTEENGAGTQYYTADMSSITPWNITSETILYAQWIINTNLLYLNGNGALDGTMEAIEIISFASTTLPLNQYTRYRYNFEGWSDVEDGVVVYVDGAEYTMGTDFEYTLYAVWSTTYNEVYFIGNGNTDGEMNAIAVVTEETVTLTANTYIKDGYTFIGWSVTSDGELAYADEASFTMHSESTSSLYALWQANNNTLVLDGNTNTSGSMDDIIIATDASAAITANAYIKDGYTFSGWATTSDGEIAYINCADYTMGSDASYTLYAIWTANSNTLILNGNSNTSGSMDNMTIATDANSAITANAYIRDGYTFSGWATTSDGATAYAEGATYTMGTASEYTLYAVWEANNNTLILNGNTNTSGAMDNMIIATDASEALTANAYIKDGYTFTGWATTSNGEIAYTDCADYTMGADSSYTLYAIWQANINTLILDGNYNTSGTMDDLLIATDASAVLPVNVYERLGYMFAGWSTDSLGGADYLDKAIYYMGTQSEYTLYAVWSANDNDLYFDGNTNTSGSTSSMVIATDNTLSLGLNGFVKTGYTFIGWSLTSGGSVAYTDGAEYTMSYEASYTLFAVWQANTNTLVFNGNGNTGGIMSDLSIATDNTVTLTLNKFVRTGYTFNGWATIAGGELAYNDGASYLMGTNASYTIFAIWTAKTYTVTFNRTPVTTGSAATTATYDSNMPSSLTAPSRTGYTFAGYFAEANGQDKQYYTSGMLSANTWDIAQDKILYASWIANQYSISFILNYTTGEATPENVIATYDATYGDAKDLLLENVVGLPTISRAGYVFDGWFTATTDGVEITNDTLVSVTGAQTLYAIWTANNNTIVFDGNTATSGAMDNMTITTDASSALTANAYVKDGYTFTGWAATSNGEVDYTDGTDYTMGPDASYTLYAIWTANNNTLVFDGNTATSGVMDDMIIATDASNALTANAYVKDGYTFTGWATTSNGEVAYTDGTGYTMGPDASYTVYAIWSANNNTLVFDGNTNTSGAMDDMTIATDAKEALTANAYVKDGYTFTGWAITFDGEVEYADATDYTMGSDASYTLYAIWIANNNTLVFDGNSATSGTMDDLILATDEKITLPGNLYERTGYTFNGWATSIDGELSYLNLADYTMGTASTYTLYAVWEANIYTVSFDNQEGNGGVSDTDVTYDSAMPLIETPVRLGYTFSGYFTETEGLGTKYYNGDMSSAKVWQNTTDDITLYAYWIINDNTLKFNANGGSGTMSDMTVTYTDVAQLPLNSFVRAGYLFNGWSITSAGEVDYTDGAEYTMGYDTIYTLYAIWTPTNNTLYFNSNGGTGTMQIMIIPTDASVSLRINQFTKDLYVFAGWATSAQGNVAYANQASYLMGTNNSYTLYAVWYKNYGTVTFDGNGNTSGSMENQTVTTFTSAVLSANSYIKDGYSFTGWSTTSTGETAYTDGATYNMGSDASYALYAVWQANSNSLIFNGNGNTSGAMANMTIATDDGATLTANAFVRTGYTFSGWSTTADGEIAYADGATYNMGTDASYALYAVWQANSNSLVFNGNGNTSGAMDNMTIATGDGATLTANAFVRTGYAFDGWSTTADGEIAYADEATYNMGTDASYALYAVWQANSNTLVFNGNCNTSGAMVNMTIATDNDGTLTANAFVKIGYTFSGWSTTSTGEIAYADGATYNMGTDASYALYAVWQANSNTLVFNGNGNSSGNMDNMIVATDDGATLTANAFIKVGYDFNGWSTTSNGEIAYTDEAAYTMGTENSYTLYAVWQIQTFDVYFVNYDETILASRVVDYGTAAIAPEIPARRFYSFTGWDKTFDNITESITVNAVYEIDKANINVVWTSNASYIYNGTDNLSSISASYVLDDATYALNIQLIGQTDMKNAGTYQLTAVFKASDEFKNFIELDNNTLAIAVNKKQITPIFSNYDKLEENGQELSVGYSFEGISEELGAIISYSKAPVSAGNYTATVEINNTNYEIVNGTLSFVIYPKQIKSDEYDITVTTDNVGTLQPNTSLSIAEAEEATVKLYDESIKNEYGFFSGITTQAVYSVSMVKDSVTTQPDNSVTVRMHLDESYLNTKNLSVIQIAEDGTITKLDSYIDGEYIVFTTDELSTFAIIGGSGTTRIASVSGGAVVVALALVIVIIVVVKKKKLIK